MTIAVNHFRAVAHDIDIFRNDNPWTHSFEANGDGTGDFTDSYTARMQFRPFEGGTGPAVLSLTGAGASRVEPNGRWRCSAIIQNADLVQLPSPEEIGSPVELRYDLLIKTAGGGESVSHYGIARIRDGVTR